MSSNTSMESNARPMATGSMLFGATMMVLAGLFQLFQGIAGIAKDQIFVTTPNYAYSFNTTAWGWIHLVLGVIVIVTGFFVFTAAPWARVVGIGLVALQALASFMFLPYFPFWALAILALDVFIIWALASGPATGHTRTEHHHYMAGEAEGAGYDVESSRRLIG
jgi:hypothetical protein